jgi:hypothetical protein
MKCMFMSHHHSEGQNHDFMIANKSFKNVVKFKYLGMTITIQNYIYKEINSILNSVTACYCSVQSLLFSHFLFRNLEV